MATYRLSFPQFRAAARRKGGLVLFLLCALALGVSASAERDSITTFDAPGAGTGAGQGTFPTGGISQLGVIAGYYIDANNVSHSFLRDRKGEITTIDPPGTSEIPFPAFNGSQAVGLNVEGAVVGVFVDANLAVHAYIRTPEGKFITYDWPGACTASQTTGCHGSGAWNINAFGVVVGPYEDTSGNFVAHTAIRFPDGKFTTFEVPGSSMEAGQGTLPAGFSGLNLFGAIAGLYYDANNAFHGFLRYPNGTFTTFEAPGADTTTPFNGTTASSLNDFGAITGPYFDINGVAHGYLRSSVGKFTTFDAPGAGTSSGQGTLPENINLLGAITGNYTDATAAVHGFVRSWDGKITTFDAPGAGTGSGQGTFPASNNTVGAITGYYIDANNVAHGFLRRP
jgi:hypothetical protein